MRRHWQYLKYVIRHKWYVFWEGIKLGPPHWWQWPFWIITLILHDWDKFKPDEWFAYRRRYFGNGTYQQQIDKALEEDNYQMAWHLHQKRNKHHWQWWTTSKEDGTYRLLELKPYYLYEMVADWMGMAKTLRKPDYQLWYVQNYERIHLHPESRKRVDELLDVQFTKDELEKAAMIADLESWTIKTYEEAALHRRRSASIRAAQKVVS